MARALNKTTMAKINRERRLQERRAEKQDRKERRRVEKAQAATRGFGVDLDADVSGDLGGSPSPEHGV